MSLRNELIALVRSMRPDGLVERDGDHLVDSLAKLDLVMLLDEKRPGFFDAYIDEITETDSLACLLRLFEEYGAPDPAPRA